MRRRAWWWWWGGGLLVAVGFVLGLRAFWLEPASLRVTSYEITSAQWPRGLDGFRIAVLGDLHVGSPFNDLAKLRRIVAETNAAHVDVVLLAGDYVILDVVGGRFTMPEDIAGVLRDLVAPLGVYAVLGNHDWYFGGPRVRDALESAAIRVLEDEAMPIDAGGSRFWLAGVGDFWEAKHDVHRALAGVPTDVPVLVFTHNPDIFPHVPAYVALTIAGHTHGGQVALPFVGRLIVPSRYGQQYAVGLVQEDGRQLFVTPGLGTSIIPVRFRVPPEISVLTLRAVTLRERAAPRSLRGSRGARAD